jgi:hypothetical protein
VDKTHVVEVMKTLDYLLEDTSEQYFILDPLVGVLKVCEVLEASRVKQRHHNPKLLLGDERAVVLQQVGMVALGHYVDFSPYVLLKLTCFLVVFEVNSFYRNSLHMTRIVLIVHSGAPDKAEVAFADGDVPLVAGGLKRP